MSMNTSCHIYELVMMPGAAITVIPYMYIQYFICIYSILYVYTSQNVYTTDIAAP